MSQDKSQEQKPQENQDVGAKDEVADPTKDFIYEGSERVEETAKKEPPADEDDSSEEEDAEESVEDDSSEEEDSEESVEDDSEGESEEEEEKPKKKPKKKQSAQDRIKELTAARRQAERESAAKDDRVAALEERLAKIEAGDTSEGLTDDNKHDKSELKAPDASEVDPKTGKPKYEYGEFDPAFRKAERDYDRAVIRQELRADLEQERQAEAESKKSTEFEQKRDAQLAQGLEKYDDFEEVVLKGALEKVPDPGPEVAALIVESENGADILYHLAQNPEEATEIASKSLVEQARYIGKLEAKFSSDKGAPKKQKKKVSKAPPPPDKRTRGTDSRSTVSDDTEDFGAFAAKYGIRTD